MKKFLVILLGLTFLYVIPLFAQIEEKVVIDSINVLENGQIQIRQATKIYKDGVEIAKTYHRHCIAPDQNITKEDIKVQNIANAVWTKEVKDNYILNKPK